MRFHLTDTVRVRRLARLLQRELAAMGAPAGYLTCLETVSRLYGYASFVDLKANIADEGSAFDEQAGPDVAADRRAHHIKVLQGSGVDVVQGALIIDRIRPTGYGRGASEGDGSVGQVPPDASVAATSHLPEKLVEALVQQALDVRATSLEFVATDDGYVVFRNRMGIHTRVHAGPGEEHAALLNSLEDRVALDGLKLGFRRWGALRFVHGGRPRHVDAFVDSGHEGKRLYLRIPDPEWFMPGLDEIGLTRVSEWRRGINRRAGLCLVCGAAGSGKSTTIGASIRELDRRGRKVAVMGDRVGSGTPLPRRILEGAAAKIGLSKGVARRLSLGPDVLVVGEIREDMVARVAVEAIEAGQLVFGTMACRSVRKAVRNLGTLQPMKGKVGSILAAVIVQQLVRVVCTTCGGAGVAPKGTCSACHGTGHAERTILSECASFDGPSDVAQVEALLEDDARHRAVPWPEMVDDGITKMLTGTLSSDEVERGIGQAFIDRCDARGIDPGAYTNARIAERTR